MTDSGGKWYKCPKDDVGVDAIFHYHGDFADGKMKTFDHVKMFVKDGELKTQKTLRTDLFHTSVTDEQYKEKLQLCTLIPPEDICEAGWYGGYLKDDSGEEHPLESNLPVDLPRLPGVTVSYARPLPLSIPLFLNQTTQEDRLGKWKCGTIDPDDAGRSAVLWSPGTEQHPDREIIWRRPAVKSIIRAVCLEIVDHTGGEVLTDGTDVVTPSGRWMKRKGPDERDEYVFDGNPIIYKFSDDPKSFTYTLYRGRIEEGVFHYNPVELTLSEYRKLHEENSAVWERLPEEDAPDWYDESPIHFPPLKGKEKFKVGPFTWQEYSWATTKSKSSWNCFSLSSVDSTPVLTMTSVQGVEKVPRRDAETMKPVEFPGPLSSEPPEANGIEPIAQTDDPVENSKEKEQTTAEPNPLAVYSLKPVSTTLHNDSSTDINSGSDSTTPQQVTLVLSPDAEWTIEQWIYRVGLPGMGVVVLLVILCWYRRAQQQLEEAIANLTDSDWSSDEELSE